MTIEELYTRAATTPGDIWEHVSVLRSLSAKCESVTEMGTRGAVSTAALLAGRPKRMIAYDIDRHQAVAEIESAAAVEGLDFRFVQADVLTVDIDPTDLLFIDTKHTYSQLIAELTRHGDKARKHIVLHDTVTFGTRGEDGGDGLLPAIQQYFRPKHCWSLAIDQQFNNGLQVWLRNNGYPKS